VGELARVHVRALRHRSLRAAIGGTMINATPPGWEMLPGSYAYSDPVYCRNCSYPLRELVSAKCPECGRVFDPEAPDSYLPQPRWLTARRKRRIGLALGSAALILTALVLLPPPYARFREFDINSGCERVAYEVFGRRVLVLKGASDFAAFAKRHLTPVGPPKWYTYSYWSPTDWRTVNFRGMRLRMDLQGLIHWFAKVESEGTPVPLEAKTRIAQAVLAVVAREHSPAYGATEAGGIAAWDETGAIIADWDPSNP
jgi:hypothetical protein